MYFVKFLYQWILPPGGLILILAIVTVMAFRRHFCGRWVLAISLAMFYALSIRVGADLLVKPLEYELEQPILNDSDVLVMLGNGSVSGVPDIDGVGQVSDTMGKNLLFAARLYQVTGIPILVSGGTVYLDKGNESDIAIRELRGLGIPNNKLYAENESRNTVENARFSHRICEEHGWNKVSVLVVAVQAPRTKIIFEREFSGMDLTIYPTHYRRSPSWHFDPVLDLVPSAKNILDSAIALKEYMGLLALYFGMQ